MGWISVKFGTNIQVKITPILTLKALTVLQVSLDVSLFQLGMAEGRNHINLPDLTKLLVHFNASHPNSFCASFMFHSGVYTV